MRIENRENSGGIINSNTSVSVPTHTMETIKKEAISKKTQTSLADMESLLNTLIVLNTFIIGFIINFIGSANYDSLYDMDLRIASMWSDFSHVFFGAPDGSTVLISATACNRSWTSLTLLSICLLLTIGSLVELNYSDSRENEDFFCMWDFFFRYIIFI